MSHVISITSTLYLDKQMVVDGTTQPGYDGTPQVLIVGNASVPSIFFVGYDTAPVTSSSGSTIQGLDIYNYTANGVTIVKQSQGNFIQNNWIGFYQDASGAVHLNSAIGYSFTSSIGIQSSYNTIRGNTLDGGYNAIVMGEDPINAFSGTYYVTNSIQYNMIGTDPTGQSTAGYGNTFDAIFLGNGASQNFLGPYNVLSGNRGNTIELLGGSVNGDVIFQDFIGTNNGATANLGNAGLGILIAGGAHGNEIGGPFGGNYISGNAIGGISLGTTGFGGAVQNFVQNNIIGLNGSHERRAWCPGHRHLPFDRFDRQPDHQQRHRRDDRGRGDRLGVSWQRHQLQLAGQATLSASGSTTAVTASPCLRGANYNFIIGNGFGLDSLGTIRGRRGCRQRDRLRQTPCSHSPGWARGGGRVSPLPAPGQTSPPSGASPVRQASKLPPRRRLRSVLLPPPISSSATSTQLDAGCPGRTLFLCWTCFGAPDISARAATAALPI